MRRRKKIVPALWLTLFVMVLAALGCKPYTENLQKSQERGDEPSVIAALRTVALAQQSYALTNEGKYATFPHLSDGGYLDDRFASDSPELHGYVLTMKVGDKTFSCNADPALSGNSKGRHFYVDSTSSLVRVNATRPATSRDEVAKF